MPAILRHVARYGFIAATTIAVRQTFKPRSSLTPITRQRSFALPKGLVTPADLQRGEDQVRRMLRDRPAMAQYSSKAKVLYQWAARKFAGEDLQEEILGCSSNRVSMPSTRLRRTRDPDVFKSRRE